MKKIGFLKNNKELTKKDIYPKKKPKKSITITDKTEFQRLNLTFNNCRCIFMCCFKITKINISNY